MPSMPSTVTKTKTFTAMDGFWSANQASLMADYDTAAFQTLLDDAVLKHGWIKDEVRKHVEDHWLNDYWSTAEARDVLHRGLYWAMRVAVFEHAGESTEKRRSAPLPICSAWVCSGGKPKGKKTRFEVITLESSHQVTLLFLTPSPALAEDGKPGNPLQPVWVTQRIEFAKGQGEEQLEEWPSAKPTTRTVRPYDYEYYPPSKP